MRDPGQIFDIFPPGWGARQDTTRHCPACKLWSNYWYRDRQDGKTENNWADFHITNTGFWGSGAAWNISYQVNTYLLAGSFCPSNELISLLAQSPGGPGDLGPPCHSHYGVLHSHFPPGFLNKTLQEGVPSAPVPVSNISHQCNGQYPSSSSLSVYLPLHGIQDEEKIIFISFPFTKELVGIWEMVTKLNSQNFYLLKSESFLMFFLQVRH